MQTRNIYKQPQLVTPNIISLMVDLQNTLYFKTDGEQVGWRNNHRKTVQWLEKEKDLMSELRKSENSFHWFNPTEFEVTLVNGLMGHADMRFAYPRDWAQKEEETSL